MGRTIVVITHEPHVVSHARRRVEIRDGLIVADEPIGAAGMSAGDVLRSALRGLSANRLRSSLTMLGILIGVAAVILLVAVGNGSAVAIQERLQSLGTNTLTVSANSGPGAPAGPAVQRPEPDARGRRGARGRRRRPRRRQRLPVQSTSTTAAYGATSATVTVTGTVPKWFEATNSPIASGEAFDQSDVDDHARVAVLGSSTAEDLFADGSDPVGRTVSLGGVAYEVVGVLEEKDSNGPQDGNASVVAPLTAVRDTLAGYGPLSSITVQATSARDRDARAERDHGDPRPRARRDVVQPGDVPGPQRLAAA